jgi:hypothetical protein
MMVPMTVGQCSFLPGRMTSSAMATASTGHQGCSPASTARQLLAAVVSNSVMAAPWRGAGILPAGARPRRPRRCTRKNDNENRLLRREYSANSY